MKRLSWVLLFLVFLAPAAPAAAQEAGVWIEPRVGWLVSTRDLGRTDILGSAGYGAFERAGGTLSLGVGVGVDLTDSWALRVTADRARDASVSGEWRCAPFVVCAAVLLPLDGELERWTGGLDLLYRAGRGWPVGATFSAGVGLRRSELAWGPPAADITLPTLTFRETRPVVRMGVGVERAVGVATLFGGAEASVGRFGGGAYSSIEGSVPADARTAVDVGLTGGARIRLR